MAEARRPKIFSPTCRIPSPNQAGFRILHSKSVINNPYTVMKNDVSDRERESYEDSQPVFDASGGFRPAVPEIGNAWNDRLTRRKFLKRTGGATAATLLAVHAMKVEVMASPSGGYGLTVQNVRFYHSGFNVISNTDSVPYNRTIKILYDVVGTSGYVAVKPEWGITYGNTNEAHQLQQVAHTSASTNNMFEFNADFAVGGWGWLKLLTNYGSNWSTDTQISVYWE